MSANTIIIGAKKATSRIIVPGLNNRVGQKATRLIPPQKAAPHKIKIDSKLLREIRHGQDLEAIRAKLCNTPSA